MTVNQIINNLKFYLISIIVLICDQSSKLWVQANFTPYVPYDIISHYLRFTLCYNPGIAFGIEVGKFHLVITILSYFITIGLIYYLYSERHSHQLYLSSIAFILGGALGNLIDRTFMIFNINNIDYPGVIDFIDVGLSPYGYRWYIFNFADTAITIGIILYLLYTYLFEPKTNIQ